MNRPCAATRAPRGATGPRPSPRSAGAPSAPRSSCARGTLPLTLTWPPRTRALVRSTSASRPWKRPVTCTALTRVSSTRTRPSTTPKVPSRSGAATVPPTCAWSEKRPPAWLLGAIASIAASAKSPFTARSKVRPSAKGTRPSTVRTPPAGAGGRGALAPLRGLRPRLRPRRRAGSLLRACRQAQAGDVRLLGGSLDLEGIDAPLEALQAAARGEALPGVAQAPGVAQGQVENDRSPCLERRSRLPPGRHRVEQRLRRQPGDVDLHADGPVALELARALQEGGLAGPSPELDLPAVRARVEGERGQGRAVEGRLAQRRVRLARGRFGRPPERHVGRQRAAEAAQRCGQERQPRPGEALGVGPGLEHARLRVEAARALDPAAGRLGGQPIHLDVASVARGGQRDRDRLAGGPADFVEHDPRVEGDPPPRRVARPLDAQRPRGGPVALEPGEGERGREVQRFDLASQVPLAGVGENRDRAGERGLSETGADQERREREPARRVVRLRLERVGVAVDGEVVRAQRALVHQARHGARQLALRDERPRVRLGEPLPSTRGP